MMERFDALLNYWFGDERNEFTVPKEVLQKWFASTSEDDLYIKSEFGADLEKAVNGEYEYWRAEPRSCLALAILCDQFPRQIYRKEAGSFTHDLYCQSVVLDALQKGFDQKVRPIERVFYYMPLEHAESLDIQDMCVQKFQSLLHDAPKENNEQYMSFYNYSLRHKDMIERFGRFPYRNEILGRDSSPEELAYLKEPGSSFIKK